MKKKSTLFALIFFVCTNLSVVAYAQAVNMQDSLALVDLYNSTDGTHWVNHSGWLTAPVNTWYGVTVESNRVVEIVLDNNALYGGMPESFGNLTALKKLHLIHNKLIGNLPNSIGNLAGLHDLNLRTNKFNGSVPESIGNLSALQQLDISHNALTGSIPVSVSNLSSLQQLDLNYNALNGSIPESIGNLSALQYLDLSVNTLSGSIPESIGSLSNLKEIYLYINQLSGNIPESIGNLTELIDLVLSDNQLSGGIPENIGNLSKLQNLDLEDNINLGGSIPESIGNLSSLQYLSLNVCSFSGSIPESIGNLSSIQQIGLAFNNLTGSIPESITNLTNLKGIYLYSNQLSGSIPENIGNLPALYLLRLDNNQLTGSVPSSLINLPSNGSVNIESNKLTFDGLEILVPYFNYLLTYAPQAVIPLHQEGNQLYVSAGGTLANNTYKWYKDGALIATITGDSTYTITANGFYNVNVTNAVCTALTLYSDTIATGVLPLTLLNFTAGWQNHNAVINWATGKEINTAQFIIQRSIDGSNFSTIGNVHAKGNSNSMMQYSFTDVGIALLNTNKIYYRLQQIDNDGKGIYSKTVALNISSQSSFTFYPNPIKNMLHIYTKSSAIISLSNSEGKTLLAKNINGNGEINTALLRAGIYYLKNNTTGEVKKVIVVR